MSAAPPTETELKFLLDAAAEASLKAHPALKAPERTQQLRSTYFDTPGRRLQRSGMALRLRDTGKGVVQTLKAGGRGGVTRGEWEAKVGEGLDLGALEATPAAEALDGAGRKLQPV